MASHSDRPEAPRCASDSGTQIAGRRVHARTPDAAPHVGALVDDPRLAGLGGMPAYSTAPHSLGAPGASTLTAGERAIAELHWHKKRSAEIRAALRGHWRMLGNLGFASWAMTMSDRTARLAGSLCDVAQGAHAGAIISALRDGRRLLSGDVAGFLLARAPWVLEELVPRLARPIMARLSSKRSPVVLLAEVSMPKLLVYVIDECLQAVSHGSGPASGEGALADGAGRLMERLTSDAQDMCSAHAQRRPSGRGYGVRVEPSVERTAYPAVSAASPTAARERPSALRLLSFPTQERRALVAILLAMIARIAVILLGMDDARSLQEALPDLLRCVAHLRTLRAG